MPPVSPPPEPLMQRKSFMTTLPTVFITGASSGIGATYAERFARRGHDLVLVARDDSRLDKLAGRLRAECHVAIEVLPADLTRPADLAALETRLREDARICILINNAGMAQAGEFPGPKCRGHRTPDHAQHHGADAARCGDRAALCAVRHGGDRQYWLGGGFRTRVRHVDLRCDQSLRSVSVAGSEL